jgi:hypothetical protein
MLNNKAFTISIGEYGVVVALHQGKSVLSKILLSSLNKENKPRLTNFFLRHKSIPIYILLDTVEQNYKKKSYPPVNRQDFNKIAKRDFKKEFEHSDKILQNYIGIKNKVSKKWECMFVSVTCSNEVDKWIDFLLGLPNKMAGIYMLPIEAKTLAEKLFEIVKESPKVKITEDTILSIIVENKISGIRQIVFSKNSIIFTRVVNYDFNNPNFSHQFEQDIFRANEYLKMIFPKLRAQDVVGVNILSEELIKKINKSQGRELNFINYTPNGIAKKFGLTNATSSIKSNFSDVIIANFFVNRKKKVLKFTNPKTSFLGNLYLLLNSCLVINALLTLFIAGSLIKSLFINYHNDEKLIKLRKYRSALQEKIQTINNAALEGEVGVQDSNLANEIIDFGKIDEVLGNNRVNINPIFSRLSFLHNYSAIASSFSFQLIGYNPKNSTLSKKFSFSVEGSVDEKDGDVEKLLRKFDTLSMETEKTFSEYKVNFSEVPKGIDFSKKYYSFPFTVVIEGEANSK